MRLHPVDPDAPLPLHDADALADDAPNGKALRRKTKRRLARISELQRVFYADGRYALLIVLQGRDASGKDGTIRKVFSACNPQGCNVTSFKAPSELEQRHDFLWRIHQAIPPRGMVGIFNRSHYEDVLVTRVREQVAKKEWRRRYDQINDFERLLAQNRVVVLKFFLHVSRGEQRRRLLKRIERRDKNWKFRMGDLDDRQLWDEYTEAYRDAIRMCSTQYAPWYVVPADDKRVRNYLISGVVKRTLESLDLRYPEADPNTLLDAEQLLAY
jgi:PPK2 family polyphosphate:nucleotide phosphotransferase